MGRARNLLAESRAGGFDAVLGARRGGKPEDSLAAPAPSPVAQAELQRLLVPEKETEALQALQEHQMQLQRPLVAELADALAERYTQMQERDWLPDTRAVLCSLGILAQDAEHVPQSLRENMSADVRQRVYDSLTRVERKAPLTTAEAYALAEKQYRECFPSAVAEIVMRGDQNQFLHRALGARYGKIRELYPHDSNVGLGDAADYERLLRAALDQNQARTPVIDSLSEKGKELWRRQLEEMISRRLLLRHQIEDSGQETEEHSSLDA